MSKKIRAWLFKLSFYLWTVIVALVTLPVFILPRRLSFKVQTCWARVTFWLLRVIGGVRYEFRGLDRIPPEPVLFACKHQSAWETIVFFLIQSPPPTFFFKKELLKVPLFGWFCLKSGMVAVDRDAGARAMRKVLQKAGERIGEGRSLVLFPEGTRMPLGVRGAYQPGVAGIYKYLRVPVVPVALNSGLCWPKGGLTGESGIVTMEFLEPIPPGLEKTAFLDHLARVLEEGSDRLVAEERARKAGESRG